MLLVHQGPLSAHSASPPLDEQPVTRAPFRRPPGLATRHAAAVERGVIGLPSEPPGGGRTPLDFDHSLAGDTAAAALLEKLRAVNVPWPVPAPRHSTPGLTKACTASTACGMPRWPGCYSG